MNTSAKLIFLCGKMAAGKSTLARDLAERHNALLLVQDEFLETLFPGEITDIPGFFDRSSRLRDALTPHIGAVLSVGVSVTSGRNRYLGPTTGIRVRGGYGFLTDATRNTVTLNSIDDRFEGLQAGVLVWGGGAGTHRADDNRVVVRLIGSHFEGTATTNVGAVARQGGPGENNRVRIFVHGATDTNGMPFVAFDGLSSCGVNNRVEVEGNSEAWQSNPATWPHEP